MPSGEPWSAASSNLIDDLGIIHDLRPKVLARAKRVVTRTHGDHPLEELLDYLGLTEVPA
jgi:hypothetical protein